MGRQLVIIGLIIILTGLGFIAFSRLKAPFIGRLPGDILVEKKNFSFYFPLTTCLLISALLSLILYFIFKFRR